MAVGVTREALFVPVAGEGRSALQDEVREVERVRHGHARAVVWGAKRRNIADDRRLAKPGILRNMEVRKRREVGSLDAAQRRV